MKQGDGPSSAVIAVDHVEMYRQMYLIRRFDEIVLQLRQANEIDGVVHPYFGEEAVAVGVCSQLRREDGLTSTHRGHGHCIAKGADVKLMMAELFGKKDGYCAGKGGSMHIADFEIGMLGANGIVAAGLPIATGAALAAKLTGTDNVAVCMFGDGAVGAGPFHESLNIASLWDIPVIYVCENNGWAVHNPVNKMLAAGSAAELARAHKVEAITVDGNDVLAVVDAAARAVSRARDASKPVLIEALTMRMSGHAYRDSAMPDPRDAALIEKWREQDPIDVFSARLLADGTSEDQLRSVRESVEQELDNALVFARTSPLPDPLDALKDVFA